MGKSRKRADDHARRITKPQCGVNGEEQKGAVLFRLITYELEASSLDAPLLMPDLSGRFRSRAKKEDV